MAVPHRNCISTDDCYTAPRSGHNTSLLQFISAAHKILPEITSRNVTYNSSLSIYVETTEKLEVPTLRICDNRLEYSVPVLGLLSVIIGLVALTTIIGNVLVIAAFFTDQKLRLFGNYFILNLAFSDLTVGLLIIVYAPYLLQGCWRLTRAGCLTFLFLDYVVPLASAWNMALISLDRYFCVAQPISYRVLMNSRRVVILMLIPWLAGALWYGPTVLFWTQITGRSPVSDGKCVVDFYDHATYLIASSFVEFVLPFLTVACINILIYLNIRRRSISLLAASARATTHGDEISQHRSLKAQVLLSRDKKSARSLSILIVVFLFTWAPFEICSFVNPICSFCIPDNAFHVVFWLLWLNSTINPILYPFLQKRFRIAFQRILRLVLCFARDEDERRDSMPIGGIRGRSTRRSMATNT